VLVLGGEGDEAVEVKQIEINERQLQKAFDISSTIMRKLAGRGEATSLLAISLAFCAKCKEYGIDPKSQVEACTELVEGL